MCNSFFFSFFFNFTKLKILFTLFIDFSLLDKKNLLKLDAVAQLIISHGLSTFSCFKGKRQCVVKSIDIYLFNLIRKKM